MVPNVLFLNYLIILNCCFKPEKQMVFSGFDVADESDFEGMGLRDCGCISLLLIIYQFLLFLLKKITFVNTFSFFFYQAQFKYYEIAIMDLWYYSFASFSQLELILVLAYQPLPRKQSKGTTS